MNTAQLFKYRRNLFFAFLLISNRHVHHCPFYDSLRHSARSVPSFVRQGSHVPWRGDGISNPLEASVVANWRTSNGRHASLSSVRAIKTLKESKKKTHKFHLTYLSHPLVSPVPSIPPNLSFLEMSHNGSFHFTGFPGYNLNDFAVDNSGMPNEPPNGFNPGYNLPNHQHAGPSNPSSRWFLPPHEVGRRSHPYMRPMAVPRGLGDLSHLRNPTTAPTTLYPGNNGMSRSPPLKYLQRLIYPPKDTTRCFTRPWLSRNR